MTPNFSASQNKIRLIAVFLFTVLLVLAVQVLRPEPREAGSAASSNAQGLDEALFMGLRHASAPEVHSAMPDAVGKPTLLVFSSRLCHDCQRMAPVLAKLMPRFQNIHYRKVDVLDDKNKYPVIFRTFKPVSVPMLVFIDARGKIRNVLYNYQKPATVAAALKQLQGKAKAKPAATRSE